MGQRFQLIVNNEGNFKVYHFQWLWGDYAIRRIGTAIKYYLKYNKNGYRSFEDYLKSSCFGKPDDMNFFNRYNSDGDLTDNKWICGRKKKENFNDFIRTLDNNDGYFYLVINKSKIVGYCFIANSYEDESLKPISARDYLKNYKRTEGFDKKQQKEFEQNLKLFDKLNLVEPVEIIKNENYF